MNVFGITFLPHAVYHVICTPSPAFEIVAYIDKVYAPLFYSSRGLEIGPNG